MTTLALIDPQTATGKTKTLLDAVKAQLGGTPNLLRVFAHSPAALESYLGFSKALTGGALNAKLREQISIAVAEESACDYCLSAHTLLGRRAGLDDGAIAAARSGRASEPKAAAALAFSVAVVRNRGHVGAGEVAKLRAAGLDDGEIVEIIANVALNLLTNYVNHIAETPIDFPVVEVTRKAA